jgi:subtilisin family serine protease
LALILVAAALSRLAVSPAHALSDAGNPDAPSAVDEIIVRFHQPPTASQLDQLRTQLPSLVSWRSLRHVPHPRNDPTGVHPLAYVRVAKLVGAFEPKNAATFCETVVAASADLIESAEPNGRVELLGVEPNDPLYPKQWGPPAIDAPGAWAITMGDSSVVVAMIDTGLQFDHEEFPPETLWTNPGEIPDNGIDDDANGFVDDVVGWNFLKDDNAPDDELFGHGTPVSGIVGARTNNSVGIAGIAQSRMMIVKALPGGVDGAIAALYYAADMRAQVANCSWIAPESPELAMAIDYASENQMTVVAGAGNDGSEFRRYPAAYPSVICVSGTTIDDVLWEDSTYGPWVDVAAPADAILSTATPAEGWYRSVRGTSLAAPHVTGLAALLYSVDPTLRPVAIRGFIRAYADDLGAPGFDDFFGYGRVNAARTVSAVVAAVACPADANRDGLVGMADVLAILANWQTDDWEADIDNSGEVDFADLLAVLASWGPCGP